MNEQDIKCKYEISKQDIKNGSKRLLDDVEKGVLVQIYKDIDDAKKQIKKWSEELARKETIRDKILLKIADK